MALALRAVGGAGGAYFDHPPVAFGWAGLLILFREGACTLPSLDREVVIHTVDVFPRGEVGKQLSLFAEVV